MTQWEVGAVVAFATASVLSLMWWRFEGRAGLGISMALTWVLLFTGTVVATPQVASAFTVQSDYNANHVTSSSNLNCSWVAEQEQMNSRGNPRIDTTATIDWGPHCTWITYTAAADRLIVAEDLNSFNSVSGTVYTCNPGPWVQGNGTNFVHQISTGWTFYTPCGDPGWYQQVGYGGFLTGAGWDWGALSNAWEYQQP